MPGEGKSIGARGIRAGGGKTGSMEKNHVWGGKLSLDSPAFITLEPDDFRVHPRVLQGILQRLLVLLTRYDQGGGRQMVYQFYAGSPFLLTNYSFISCVGTWLWGVIYCIQEPWMCAPPRGKRAAPPRPGKKQVLPRPAPRKLANPAGRGGAKLIWIPWKSESTTPAKSIPSMINNMLF